MIVDNIKNFEKYTSLHKDFAKAFSFIRDLKEDAQEGTTIIDEDNVWVNVIEVNHAPQAEGASNSIKVFEAHKKYLDIHYILCGEEKFGYANKESLKIKQPYNAEEDYELLEGETNAILLKKGDFAITYPEDAHIPDLEKACDGKLVRVVAKVRISERQRRMR